MFQLANVTPHTDVIFGTPGLDYPWYRSFTRLLKDLLVLDKRLKHPELSPRGSTQHVITSSLIDQKLPTPVILLWVNQKSYRDGAAYQSAELCREFMKDPGNSFHVWHERGSKTPIDRVVEHTFHNCGIGVLDTVAETTVPRNTY